MKMLLIVLGSIVLLISLFLAYVAWESRSKTCAEFAQAELRNISFLGQREDAEKTYKERLAVQDYKGANEADKRLKDLERTIKSSDELVSTWGKSCERDRNVLMTVGVIGGVGFLLAIAGIFFVRKKELEITGFTG